MKYKKEHYKKINIGGYYWGGFWDNMRHFVKKEKRGYLSITCDEEDLENGNLEYMVENRMTRGKG